MAFKIVCDVCEDEIESGTGRPSGHGARVAHCAKCAGIEALVEAEIRKRGQVWALEKHAELEALRKSLRAELRGGAPTGAWKQELPAIEAAS